MSSLPLIPPKLHRQWALCHGAAQDHRGQVTLSPIDNFDLDRTIFSGISGRLPKMVTRIRVGRQATWPAETAAETAERYQALQRKHPLPAPEPTLIAFLEKHCDFSAEHADGSFWEHLLFGYEYCVRHYPEVSARVMLLHSILGTGTNTFAMPASAIPQLREHLNEFEWRHIQAFPSVLRLLYHGRLLRTLEQDPTAWERFEQLHLYRVIDNKPFSLSREDVLIQLNYQLLHLVDFVPIANWYLHRGDPSFIVFRRLHRLLANKHALRIRLRDPGELSPAPPLQETFAPGTRWVWRLPMTLTQRMASRAMAQFSRKIGHCLEYELSETAVNHEDHNA